MQEEHLQQLLYRYKTGTATDDEKAFVESWYLQYKENGGAEYTLEQRLEDAEAIWSGLQPVKKPVKIRSLWPRLAAAASILLVFSGGGAYYFIHKRVATVTIAQNKINDIPPGGNKAVLTLSNGKKIILTGAQNGKLALQGNIAINKTADGQVVYTAAKGVVTASTAITYNTMTTPKGGQYWVILPDGSKVLLNASSSLRYPTSFTGKERVVALTGEAYFEIAHNDALPFKVTTGSQVVEDIGTHFNINAYTDEPEIRTTLLEGRVKISQGQQAFILKPGQQAQNNVLAAIKNIQIVSTINEEGVIAWKNGFFDFKKADIRTIMRQAARWYDVNITYEGTADNNLYSGRISRNVNLSELMNILKFIGLNFKQEGKNIIIKG